MSQLERTKLDQKWQELIDLIKQKELFDSLTISNIFNEETYLYSVNDGLAIIVVPYQIQMQVYKRFLNIIEDHLSIVFDEKISCQIVLKKDMKVMEQEEKRIEEKKRNTRLLVSKINKLYTFDNFVVGKCNREAHAAASAACLYPSTINNPLFIHGKSGLGKTHLMHAIANHILEDDPNAKLLYIDSSDLVDLLINSLKDNSIEEIKEYIANLDYLLIDDIQRLKQRSGSQEIFFNLYNKLIMDNKHIILSSDMPPEELVGIEDRLVSRFSAGLTVYVGSPEFETAKAILKMKLKGRKEADLFADDVLDFLATQYASDVRMLEGRLNTLIFKSLLHKPDIIDMEFTRSVLEESGKIDVNEREELSPLKIKKVVCEFYGLTVQQIESKARTKNIANARHIAIYLCRKHLQLPFIKIGFEFGNRDHSTIKSSFDRITKFYDSDNDFKSAILKLEKMLNV